MADTKERVYRRVAAAMAEPWVITERGAELVAEVLCDRIANGPLVAAGTMDGEVTGAAFAVENVLGKNIAVVPVRGVMSPRMDAFSNLSGGVDTTALAGTFRELAASGAVDAVVLDMDTPGGQVSGVPEASAALAALAEAKPVVASVNYQAASGGYWLASQATKIVASDSATLGSIGVKLTLRDYSERLKAMGVATHEFTAGEVKGLGADHRAPTKAEAAHIKQHVAAIYDQFVSAVAKGRDVDAATARRQWATGGVWYGEQAVAAGLADIMGGLEEAKALAASLAKGNPNDKRSTRMNGTENVTAAATADAVVVESPQVQAPPATETKTEAAAAPVVDVAAEVGKALAAERTRVKAIADLGAVAGFAEAKELAAKCSADGLTVEQARATIFDAMSARLRASAGQTTQAVATGAPADPPEWTAEAAEVCAKAGLPKDEYLKTIDNIKKGVV